VKWEKMKFEVDVFRTIIEQISIEVEAESSGEAEAKVRILVKRDPSKYDWSGVEAEYEYDAKEAA
jgi:hypothetical protein